MKKYWIYTLIFFSFLSCKGQKGSYIDYYYELNNAIIAKDKSDFNSYHQHIFNAYEIINNLEPHKILSIHYVRMIEFVHQTENRDSLVSFIESNPFYGNSDFLLKLIENQTLKNIVKEKQSYIAIGNYYNKHHLDITKKIDTLYAIDQYVRGQRWMDTLMVKENYKGLTHEQVTDYVLEELIALIKSYGIFGNSECFNCDITTLLVHIDSYEKFEKIQKYALEMIKNGYLQPNSYAWAFDRAYNQKYGTFYYYFSLNPPFNDTNYKPLEELTEQEKEIINKRRKEIGIPKLPYEFAFISPITL